MNNGEGRMVPRSPLLAALGTGPRRAPLLRSEHGSTKAVFRRNLTEAPAPKAPMAQVGVSPINRTHPSAVLNTTPSSHSAPMQPVTADQQIVAPPGTTPSPASNATFPASAARPGARIEPNAANPNLTAGNAGAIAAGTYTDPATAQIEQLVPAVRALGTQPQQPQINLAQLLPALHSAITQALMGQRPPAWQQVLGNKLNAGGRFTL